MARCPKCNNNIYDVEYIENSERIYGFEGFDGGVIQSVKVTCCCGHEYWVKEFFTFSHSETMKE